MWGRRQEGVEDDAQLTELGDRRMVILSIVTEDAGRRENLGGLAVESRGSIPVSLALGVQLVVENEHMR